ncbi:BRO family protein [Propionibacterium freudenreichii]|nr:BRO family protein [Propionibacterium freudenreichii]SCQ81383.1 BRO family protein [Propionibacterium freudenreichii]
MSVIPFSYDDHPVRVIERDGEPWFVASDVCRVLSIRTDSIRSILEADEVGTTNPNTIGVAPGGRDPLVISEAGLYSLVLRSRKAQAVPFRRWVTHEVIPSIRKRGMYATPDAVEAMLADPDVMIRTLTELKAQRAKVAQLQPKADYVDAFVADEDLRLLRNVAKSIGVQEGALRDALLAHEWIYVEESSRWSNSQGCKVIEHRYSPMSDKARYFRPVPNHQAPRFKGEVMHTLKVTPAGAEAISKMAKRWGLVAQEVAA